MKTYFKRSHDRSSTFYASSDLPNQGLPKYPRPPRIVQPSTREQQRLLALASTSSSSSERLQHVHWGKYGIKPLWPSDESSCDQIEDRRKSITDSWKDFFFNPWKTDRDRCWNSKSDSQKKNLLSSFIDPQYESLFILTSISCVLLLILLLLLVYILQRRERTKTNQRKPFERERRRSHEDYLQHHSVFEDRLSTAARSLPTIVEENPATLSPPVSPSSLPSITIRSPTVVVTDDSDSSNLSSASQHQCQTPLNPNENPIKVESQDDQTSSTVRRRRSRFDQNSSQSASETPPLEANIAPPPVIVRKLSTSHQQAIGDNFTSLEQINQAVKDVGLVHSQLIFGIDYTISNLETGKNSFNGLSLHHIEDGLLNPYQSVITIVGRTLEKFDSDTLIPVFGFGDRTTLDRKIFPLRPDGSYCKGFRGVLEAYNEITPKIRMSGPTNFAPLIREAIRIVKKTRQYHILVIVADGQVTNEKQTKDTIVEASNYPLSIVMIGVGDGPWDMMKEFDDSLPTRQFDNFQFVNFNSIVQASKNDDATFALHALMEIPSQYAAIKELGLLKET